MNKSDLIEALARETKISWHEAKSVINTILETISGALIFGNSVEIRGFGSFTIRKYKDYKGRHPKTGKIIQVEQKKLPFFKVAKELREKVGENRSDSGNCGSINRHIDARGTSNVD